MQSVTVRMYETYDLSTSRDKMGLIAIRTPSMPYIEKRYPGLIRQFKFVTLNKCDVVLSCASSLPADPLQIGQTAGSIAPQDMFNPLLYTAVSNDSWNGLLNRIYASSGATSNASGSLKFFDNAFSGADGSKRKDAYYGLLSENKFKKAYVQSGLEMRGLVPLVYPVLTPNGQNAMLSGTSVPAYSNYNSMYSMDNKGDAGLAGSPDTAGNILFKGTAQHMPRLQTKVYAYNQGDDTVTNVTPSIMIGGIPACYVAAIITPPATLNITYFRMTICWTATFSVLESDIEIGALPTVAGLKNQVYFGLMQNQQVQSVKADEISDYSDTSVDADEGDVHRSAVADGVTLDLIMEK